ncbi:MAG: hypothetical protein Alpg2KO_18520 [Alphaproteobacteria bacterium]
MSDEGADLFREIEEEEKRAKMEAQWKKYGPTVVTLASVVVIGVAVGVWFQTKEIETARISTERLVSIPDGAAAAAGESASNEEIAEARADLYDKLGPNLKGERAVLAQMLHASALVEAGNNEKGAMLFLSAAENTDLPAHMRRAALIQGASAGVGHVDPELLILRLAPLIQKTDKWGLLAKELTAMAELQRPDGAGLDRARELLEEVSLNPDAGSITRNRAAELMRGLGQ